MCGIVGYIGTRKAVPVLINGLLALEYRGYDSAGLAVLSDSNSISVVKDKGRVSNLQSNSLLNTIHGSVGIAHTRWATHGVPSEINAHPHLDNSDNFAVVHNGIIENYDTIKALLLEKGYELHSDTDTEVIPNLIHFNCIKLLGNKEISGLTQEILLSAISLTVKELVGSYAFEVISPIFSNYIVAVKKDCPLVIGVGKGENFVASDIPAVLSFTKDFYFLEDSEIALVYNNDVKIFDFDLNPVSKEVQTIDWDAISSEKNGYEDFMLKEIYEQPQALRNTIGSSLSGPLINLPLENIDFMQYNKIFIIACGTAMHSGLASKYTFEKYCKIPVEVSMASEFRYNDPLIDDKTLCIFISQSGETADTIAALKLAKEAHCLTIAVVNVMGSSITRLADYTLYTKAGPEIAVASTKAYTCQVTLLNILALYIAEKLNGPTDEISHLKSEILALPDKIHTAFKISNEIQNIANTIYSKPDMFFVGRGNDYYVAMEGSLKLKEISYIHSEAYPAGELKHGPIALIEDGVTVVGIATNEITTLKTISNLEEVISRGANVIVITNQDIQNPSISNIITIPTCNLMLSPILSVIPLQLLAYYIAKNKKLDVDKPRNLAKSVTVE